MPTVLKIDEINKLYDPADRIIRFLVRKNGEIFDEAGCSLRFASPRKIISYSKEMFDELEELAELSLLRLANDVLKEQGGKKVDSEWIKNILSAIDPTTQYRFTSEVERKRGRFEEGVLSSNDRYHYVDTPKINWTRMMNQYAIIITDHALLQSYKDKGIKYVKWVSVKDTRCCGECSDYDGKVFEIDKVPPKPHWGCRCRLVGYTK